MKNYTFTNNGKTYKRVNKTTARAAFVSGATVYFVPCNLRPFGFWAPEVGLNKENNDDPATDDKSYFNKIVNCFTWYNCTNAETGKYTAFYIEA